MQTLTFDTRDFGKVECKIASTGNGVAYFFKDDYESDINNYEFVNMWGVKFRIHIHTKLEGYTVKSTHASLDVWMPREISRVTI